ncbi:hypothetical protein IGI04_001906 [Brassica rapa subsp. trilocularis]|uniref:Neprosin activation peptide domain-containing protein n=1 Tax=Brassica rapa subsp. trilocularis TaxID=1813537 RepID=A0ABQ7NU55_BRACM|nr:hypothetical protein IGI04_001906 [Brassica rapa subsp. trilocularis]
MDEPNRKPFLDPKPIILNPTAPLHSLEVRERDTCQDPHCEGHISPGRYVLIETPSEGHVSKDSKPHHFTGMQPPSPQSSEIHHKSTTASAGSKTKRDQISTLEPKTVETIYLETPVYALRYITINPKVNKDIQIES